MITACEMTLEMFGDWGNMVGVKGIGVRLDVRICNTMKAFALSENGVKPGLTVVLEETKQKMLDLIRHVRQCSLLLITAKRFVPMLGEKGSATLSVLALLCATSCIVADTGWTAEENSIRVQIGTVVISL